LGKKIVGGTSVLLAMVLLISGLGLYSVNRLKAAFDDAVNGSVQKIVSSGKLDSSEGDMLIAQRGFLLYGMIQDAEMTAKCERSFTEGLAASRAALEEIRPLIVKEEARRSMEASLSGLRDWETIFSELQKLMRAQKPQDALQLATQKALPLFAELQNQSDKMVAIQRQNLKNDQASIESLQSWMRGLTALLFALGLAAGAGALWVSVTSTRQLRQISTEINQGAHQVASASAQMSSVSQSLAQGASEQAASLEETSASTEELNAMTKQSADGARRVAEETVAADQYLQETNGRLTQMIDSMHSINASSEKISKIIRVIDEIAFQTNILALNAAVEAARAGDAGLGFAVVADEVRSLAQRCAQAAKDTSELIEESVTRSMEGKSKLDEVSASISKVVVNAAQIRRLAEEVKQGSSEQANGIEQIARTVVQMQQVTQSTAASAEEGASAGEEMSSQAESLRHSAQLLQSLVG
jgi:methyl-accepting chemotaxis protein/methyl-accepting chemotaxis protein-1 (serine sensor receptor)